MSADEERNWLDELMLLNDATDKKMTEKQLRIVEAAVDIFSSKGYSAASTSEIALKAGVAEGTIFRHYKTKKDLLLSIVGPIMAKTIAPLLMKDFVKQVIDPKYDRFEDLLRAIIINRMEFVRKHLPIIKIVFYEIPFHAELKDQIANQIAKHVFEKFVVIIGHFQQQGQIIDIPPVSVIRLCMSTMFGFIMARYLLLPDHAWNDQKEIDMTIDFILYGLSPEGRTRPGPGGKL